MADPIIEVLGLTKRFGSKVAVRNLSFAVSKGGVFGILGPNGSGKTTTLNTILELIHPTEGEVRLFGAPNSHEARKRMGVSLEGSMFHPNLSGRRNLRMMALLKGVSFAEVEEKLALVELSEDAHRKFKNYSMGMKQRVAIASALLGDPEVLILDEPTNGLDPLGIIWIRDVIIQYAAKGKTVVLASHLLDEMQKCCDHLLFLYQGQKVAESDKASLLAEHGSLESAFLQLTQQQTPVI